MTSSIKSALIYLFLIFLGWGFFWWSLANRINAPLLLASLSYLLGWVMALVVFFWATDKAPTSRWLAFPGVRLLRQVGFPPRRWLVASVAPVAALFLVLLAF